MSITPILATEYGNFYAFLTGVLAMLLACSLGVVGLVWRFRALAVLSSLVLFVTALWFLTSLEDAREVDVSATIVAAIVAGGMGLTLLLWKRAPSRTGGED
jgi:uncharacterized membrane protein YqgA involved in biofilm formation